MRLVRRNGFLNLDDLFDVPVLNDSNLRTDVIEEDDKYLLEIEIPGISKENIKISFDDGYLIVEAKRESKKDDSVKYIKRERPYSDTSRKYYFGEVNSEKITASFSDGLLFITVLKKEPQVKDIIID